MTLRTLTIFACLMAWALGLSPAMAQQPPQEPFLRIDPGMHLSVIRRIGVDANCSLLVTGSDDKTLRLWTLPDGKLVRTLRAPIGQGHEGKFFATTMAPDASWIAAGGWDAAYPSTRMHYVYVFNTSTGAIATRLGPVGDVVNHLTVSHDGRYLAAVLHGGHGLRVWQRNGADLSRWTLVAEDTNYGSAQAYGASFDRSGVLYTVGYDGKLRRYEPGYRAPPRTTATKGGRHPFSLAVHPSGNRVAVSFDDTTAIDIYDASTLTHRFAADTKQATFGNLIAVGWSPDGGRLYAGGRFQKGLRSPLMYWDLVGTAAARDLEGPQDTVMHLAPCADGMIMAAFDPAFGLLARDGSRKLWRERVQSDMRGQRDERGFRISSDGRRVRWGLESNGRSPVMFDLVTEQLSDSASSPSDLRGPDTTSLAITDWVNNRNPKLAGKPIQLQPYEEARSLAISPNKQHFVLGADWSVRGYTKDGDKLWEKQVPDTVWGVHVTGDGRFAVAAYGDGTIRWHRLTDGEELLALFVHAKDRRWVMWTPKGYYMASPGAESLIGWHVNRGWDEAPQFFGVDRFREQFNRPDIVKLALESGDERRAIQEANLRTNTRQAVEDVRAVAPPMVVIQSPGDGATFRSSEVTIEYDVFSPTGQEITKVDYFVNNAALGARFVPPAPTGKFKRSGKVPLPLPPEDVTVTIVAYEGNRASEPVTRRLRWDGPKAGQVSLPRLRGLFVGVNNYESPGLTKLSYASKDATDLAAFFRKHEGKSYSKVDAKELPNAKRIEVLDGLEWLERGSEEGDVNILFLAGHGATIDQHFYYMAVDSDPGKARATAVSRDEIVRTIQRRKGTMIVMLDACHSGATSDASAGGSRVDMNRLANELGDKSLRVLLYASAQGRQFSFERDEWRNGAFTRAMLDGLSGAADSEKLGYVDTEELSVFVRRRVMSMTKGQQVPVRVKPDATEEMRIVLLK